MIDGPRANKRDPLESIDVELPARQRVAQAVGNGGRQGALNRERTQGRHVADERLQDRARAEPVGLLRRDVSQSAREDGDLPVAGRREGTSVARPSTITCARRKRAPRTEWPEPVSDGQRARRRAPTSRAAHI